MSECIQLAGDFVNMLENGSIFDESVVLGKPISAQPFIEEFSHVLTGVQLSIDITVDYEWNACEIPFGKQTINVYTDVINYNQNFNSIAFLCGEDEVQFAYGQDQETFTAFINMLNTEENFLAFGTYYDNGDSRIRCEMPITIYNQLCGETLTMTIFRD